MLQILHWLNINNVTSKLLKKKTDFPNFQSGDPRLPKTIEREEDADKTTTVAGTIVHILVRQKSEPAAIYAALTHTCNEDPAKILCMWGTGQNVQDNSFLISDHFDFEAHYKLVTTVRTSARAFWRWCMHYMTFTESTFLSR